MYLDVVSPPATGHLIDCYVWLKKKKTEKENGNKKQSHGPEGSPEDCEEQGVSAGPPSDSTGGGRVLLGGPLAVALGRIRQVRDPVHAVKVSVETGRL